MIGINMLLMKGKFYPSIRAEETRFSIMCSRLEANMYKSELYPKWNMEGNNSWLDGALG